jgi:MoxR-like ATPase
LIDEIDKSDIDLPNDLLHAFEEGGFELSELQRLPDEQSKVLVRAWDGDDRVPIDRGRVRCREFPFVLMTSNGERDFPPAFLRRCLRLTMPQPSTTKLGRIVEAHLPEARLTDQQKEQRRLLIANFLTLRDKGDLANDQLLNALQLSLSGVDFDVSGDGRSGKNLLLDKLWKYLSTEEGQ